MYYEEKQMPIAKEQPLGHQIFELLDGRSPEEQREAIGVASEMIHRSFEQKLLQKKEELDSISKAWEVFKGNN